jgi:hypothetical protein
LKIWKITKNENPYPILNKQQSKVKLLRKENKFNNYEMLLVRREVDEGPKKFRFTK